MIWIIYNILFCIVLFLTLPLFVWKMLKRGGYGPGFMERFCFVPEEKLKMINSCKRIWVHAVSVGEVQIALGFIDAYRRKSPDVSFLISTTTSTAHKICSAKKHADDVLVYVPLDLPCFTDTAMRMYSPGMLVLTETEIWPNLIRSASKAGIKVCIINGRMAVKTQRWYETLGMFFRPVVSMIDAAFMQARADADRVISLGADISRVKVIGNAKYDIAIKTLTPGKDAAAFKSSLGLSGKTVLVGGSTWPGEEMALAEVFAKLTGDYPDLRLVIVPRHMERRNEISGQIQSLGFNCIKRSAFPGGYAGSIAAGDIWLIDTTGELVRFYAAADIVYIGRTLFNRGGQNMIEPACLGKPIISGVNVQNFEDVAGCLNDAGGMVKVADTDQLAVVIRELLKDKSKREELGRNARKAIESQSGAMDRYVDAVAGLMREEVP